MPGVLQFRYDVAFQKPDWKVGQKADLSGSGWFLLNAATGELIDGKRALLAHRIASGVLAQIGLRELH